MIPKGERQILAVYGDPRGKSGRVNPAWVREHMVRTSVHKPERPMILRCAYTGREVRAVWVHRSAEADVQTALTRIWTRARLEVKQAKGFSGHSSEQYDRWTQEYLDAHGLATFGGSWVYRTMRGGLKLSTHSWGIALDWNPAENAQGTAGNMPGWWVGIWEGLGWTWGGMWRGKSRDPMHVQRASGY